MDHSSHGGGDMGGMNDMPDNSSSSSSSSSHSDMMGSGGGHGMSMTFFSAQDTPLFSTSWTPSTSGQYAGTCIFLIVLAIVFRALLAVQSVIESRARHAALNRRYVAVAEQTPAAERVSSDPDAKTSTLLGPNGVEEKVRVVQRAQSPHVLPWRFSVDLPRALLVMVTAGVGYLLMLAVMTMNVGYFMSVLAGVLLGDLGTGRFTHIWEEH